MIGTAAPVTPLAPGETRNAITSATWSGVTHLEVSASGMAARFCGVSRMVGSTQFTLMPWPRSSAAALSVARMTDDLDAQ